MDKELCPHSMTQYDKSLRFSLFESSHRSFLNNEEHRKARSLKKHQVRTRLSQKVFEAVEVILDASLEMNFSPTESLGFFQ